MGGCGSGPWNLYLSLGAVFPKNDTHVQGFFTKNRPIFQKFQMVAPDILTIFNMILLNFTCDFAQFSKCDPFLGIGRPIIGEGALTYIEGMGLCRDQEPMFKPFFRSP